MKKRSSLNYYARIERIQKWYSTNPGLHVNELLNEMADTPRGTLSSLISLMHTAGHLVRHEKGFYTLPEMVASAKSVAFDIAKSKKNPSLFTRKRKHTVHTFPKPTEPKKLFNGEEFETIQEKIKNAIDLLKSQGYKVLAKKTEYTEI